MTTPFLFVPTFSWPAAPGGLLYTYAAGGTSAKATYSDAAGSTPNTNPVVLDSNGSSTIRLGAGAYHFVLKDSTGTTTIWDQDNYSLVDSTAIGLALYAQTAVESIAGVTPTAYTYPNGPSRYGAKGDGTTDDTTSWASVAKINGYHFAYDGTYKITAKVKTSAFITVEGSTRQNTTLQSAGFADYVLEIGSVVGGPNPNVGALHRLRFTGGTAANLGLLHMNSLSHMWNLNELLFQSSNCPAIVVTNCWDSNYTNIDVLSCGTSGSDPSVGASLIITGGCNNLYLRGIRLEQGTCGLLYIGGSSPIWLVTGKCDQGFIAQNAATITVDATSALTIDEFTITGVNNQYTVNLTGELHLERVDIDGGTNMSAHILDRRSWSQINSITKPTFSGASFGPVIPRLSLGTARFGRSHPSVSNVTGASVNSKQTVRSVLNCSTTANGSVSGNSITVATNLSITANGQYNGCYLVHNPTGTQAAGQAGARRKIVNCFTGGNVVLQGTWGVTLDSDWSVEYCGGHHTQIEQDNVWLEPGMDLFAVLSTGVTISATVGYQGSIGGAAGGATAYTIVSSAFPANTDATGYYLVDEITGEPYLISYGVDGSTNLAVMYDTTGSGDPAYKLNTAHTFSIVAGYHADIRKNGSTYDWMFAGLTQSCPVKVADANGFDPANMPLWGLGTNRGSFTGTITGFGSTVTGTVNWIKQDNIVTLVISAAMTGTSNATTMTMTGLPAALSPTREVKAICSVEDNGTTDIPSQVDITANSTTLLFYKYNGTSYSQTAFTAAGTKGLASGWMIQYPLQ